MRFIGIDPGLDGAAAMISDAGAVLSVFDTPTLLVGKGGKRDYDLRTMRAWLGAFSPWDCDVAIEHQQAFPGQGVTSMFSLGRGYGLWLGLLAGLGMSYSPISPVRWRKAMLDGMPKGKDTGRLRAMQLFPQASLSRKRDHGRADALLLAEYFRRVVKP
jgi:crossover junction endodeoxyribonuclease RuvC